MKKSTQIPKSRIRHLQEGESEGDYVLYHMQSTQRSEHNPALEWAILKANQLEQRLLVSFAVDEDFPEANTRSFDFMLKGLQQTAEELQERGVKFVARRRPPANLVAELSKQASWLILDRGYLRYHREFEAELSKNLSLPITQIETESVVPHELVSDKQEYAARTIRPKVMDKLESFRVSLEPVELQKHSLQLSVRGDKLEEIRRKLSCPKLADVDRFFPAGTQTAKRRFQEFLKQDLSHYDKQRNQAQTSHLSHMSPYLHFGQISATQLLLMLDEHMGRTSKNSDSFVEELAVRRSLAQNYCIHQPDYDSFSGLPEWAQQTLEAHKDDPREDVYTRDQLENGETHDPYWNAAQKEMRVTGYMHNHMRMYWGKQILRWCNTPQYAYKTALYLNNKYFLDGRDPNSYSNVSWLFGLHDQGWKERPIYGKVRCMTSGGLERKCDPEAYVKRVEKVTSD